MREVTFGNMIFFAIGWIIMKSGWETVGGIVMAWAVLGWLAYVFIDAAWGFGEDDVD